MPNATQTVTATIAALPTGPVPVSRFFAFNEGTTTTFHENNLVFTLSSGASWRTNPRGIPFDVNALLPRL